MKTILFNNIEGKIISQIFNNGYKVDGKPQPVDPPIYELEYISTSVTYNPETQVATSTWEADINTLTYTQVWTVRDKTEAELTAEAEMKTMQADSTLDTAQTKELLRLTTESLPEEQQVLYPSIYPAYRVNYAYAMGDKFQYENQLYKVVQAHTSQLDWKPNEVPALYVNIAAPNTIPVWVQPTGAQDAYMIGDKVHFPTISDPVYQSLVEYNVWSPLDYPTGWQLIP